MDRDPQAITDDVKDFDAVMTALDPKHEWKLDDASGNFLDSGYGAVTLTVTGTPGRAQATGFTGISGARFVTTSFAASSSIPTTTTTFSIFLFLKILTDYIDATGLLFGASATAYGLNVAHDTLRVSWRSSAGNHWAAAMEGLQARRTYGIGLVVTAGVPQWYLDGVPVAIDDLSSTATIPAITPNRLAAIAAGTSEFRGDVSRLAYFPGVALTDSDMAALWSARFSCHTSSLAIVNKALSQIGQSRALTNLSTDTTAAGVAARLYYATAVESVLRAYVWPFASRFATLELVDGSTDTPVNTEWIYSYRAPERMLRAIKITNAVARREQDPNAPTFLLGQDALGTLIFTDTEDAELEYTIRTTCPAQQGDVWFREALAWYLSAQFVPTLSQNEKTVEFCLSMADAAIRRAAAGVANEQEPQDRNDNDAPWIADRRR